MKAADLVFDTPIIIKPHHTVGYARNLLHKRAHGAAVVVDGEAPIPVGLITDKDLAGRDNFTQVGALMSTTLVTLPEEITPEQAFAILHDSGKKLAPVIRSNGELKGF